MNREKTLADDVVNGPTSPLASPGKSPLETHAANPLRFGGSATGSVATAPGLSARADLAKLISRLTLGAVMLPHGMQKVFGAFGGAGFAGTIDHFRTTWGIPAALTVLVMAAEFLGSAGLLLGVLTRLCALGVAAVMFGAVFLAHADNGFFMNWTGQAAGEGFEYHILAIGLALVVILRGGGRWSLDQALRRRRAGK